MHTQARNTHTNKWQTGTHKITEPAQLQLCVWAAGSARKNTDRGVQGTYALGTQALIQALKSLALQETPCLHLRVSWPRTNAHRDLTPALTSTLFLNWHNPVYVSSACVVLVRLTLLWPRTHTDTVTSLLHSLYTLHLQKSLPHAQPLAQCWCTCRECTRKGARPASGKACVHPNVHGQRAPARTGTTRPAPSAAPPCALT